MDILLCRPYHDGRPRYTTTRQFLDRLLFKTDGTGEIFDIEAVHDNNGHAQLDIYEEEREADLEDTPMPAEAVVASERVQAAVDVFHDLCERRGLTEEEKDLIWNAMAGVCYEHVQQRQGAFYEAIKPLLAKGGA